MNVDLFNLNEWLLYIHFLGVWSNLTHRRKKTTKSISKYFCRLYSLDGQNEDKKRTCFLFLSKILHGNGGDNNKAFLLRTTSYFSAEQFLNASLCGRNESRMRRWREDI